MASQDDTTPFQWGAGGARLTPDEIAARRKVADAMAAQAGDMSPIRSWTQGLARVAQGISAGIDYRMADNAAKANDTDNKQMIAALLGGGTPTTTTDTSATPVASAPPGSVASGPVVQNDDNAIPGTVGMNQRLADVSQDFIDDHPGTSLSSGLRSREDQARLYADRDNNPNPVAPPGTSLHERGLAADIGGMTPAMRADLPAYGLAQPVADDPPHVQLAAAQAPGGLSPTRSAAADDATLHAGATPAQGYTVPGQPAPTSLVAPAVSPGVTRVSGVLAGVNPAVLQAATSPYSSEATKRIAGIMLQAQLGKEKKDQYGQETDAQGNIWSVNKTTGQRTVALPGKDKFTQETDDDGNVWSVNNTTGQRTVANKGKDAFTQETDKDGNVWSVNSATGQRTVAKAADKPSATVTDYEYAKADAARKGEPFTMDFPTWSVAKARAGSTNVVNNVGAENKGLQEALKLDAEAVRKGQNEQTPALEEADHNFQLMQAAIERNGGKLPTGGELGKMGLDWNRTKDYIAQNWGIDLGSDPTQTTSLETFNKGGIKAAGDMAKAVGGNRVLKVEFDMAQKANPGLETSDAGNKYLLDVNRNGIAIKRDYLQAQEDYWRANNHSLDGFQKHWNEEIHTNPRPLSNFTVAPPIDGGSGTQFVKLPSTAKSGYSWFEKGPSGSAVVSDPAITEKLDAATVKAPETPTSAVEKKIGDKTYVKQGNNWFEKH